MSIRSLITAALLGFLFPLSAACGGGDGDFVIDDAELSGAVGGQAWTFVSGDTDFFLSDGEDDFFATLYASEVTPCGFGSPEGDFLIVAVPKEPGEYGFGLSQNMTFVVGESQNLVATSGVIRVDEVTDTLVRGGLHGVFDGENEVSGTFEITVCSE